MLRVNSKVYVVAGAAVAAVLFAGLAGYEYQQGKALDAQVKEVKTLSAKQEELIKALTPVPSATPTAALKEVKPVVTTKPNLSRK